MLWFLCVAGLPIAGANAARAAWDKRPGRAALWAGLAVGAAVAAVLLWPGKFYVEKSLTRLAVPTGLVWLALCGVTGWLLYRRRWKSAAVAGCAAVLFTAAGNPALSDRLARTLQGGPIEARPGGDFDVLCVLGGGVSAGPGGEPMVNAHGERAVLAARMYHAGRAPRLVATGSAPPRDLCPGPGPVTQTLWEGLAVPTEAIRVVPGTTTSEELTALAAAADDARDTDAPWRRVGLISSAWHLPRALRLAENAGLAGRSDLELVPIPADFVGELSTTTPHWIPDSGSLAATDRCLKEWLARLVGR